MIKFGKSLVEYEKKLIEFERKRTILYLSMLNNKKIWIDIWKGKESDIISGIVRVVRNGEIKNNKHLLLGGRFSFNNDMFYSINDIFALSFKPFSFKDEKYKTEWAKMFNSSVYGDESELKSDVLFSWTDLTPQDFNQNTLVDKSVEFTAEFRSFNTRYYEALAKSLGD